MRTVRGKQPKDNVNLWIVPLKMSLAARLLLAVSIRRDLLASYHVIDLPDWWAASMTRVPF